MVDGSVTIRVGSKIPSSQLSGSMCNPSARTSHLAIPLIDASHWSISVSFSLLVWCGSLICAKVNFITRIWGPGLTPWKSRQLFWIDLSVKIRSFRAPSFSIAHEWLVLCSGSSSPEFFEVDFSGFARGFAEFITRFNALHVHLLLQLLNLPWEFVNSRHALISTLSRWSLVDSTIINHLDCSWLENWGLVKNRIS